MAVRLRRLETTVVRTVFERFHCLREINFGTLAPVTLFPLVQPNLIYGGRTWTSALDSIPENQAWINRITMNVLTRPILDSAVLANNTGYNQPILYRMFLVNLKFAIRQSVASTVSNLFPVTSMTKGVHYDYANSSGNMPFFAPFLNPEFFSILAYKDYKYIPSVVAVNTQTAVVDPNYGFKTWKFSISPKLKLDGKSQPWSTIEDDDVPFSRQVYCCVLAHPSATASAPVPFRTNISLMYSMTQVQGR